MRVSLVFLVVFFSAPFQGKLNSVAGACACGCASVGRAGSGGRRDLQVGHEGATCPSPGTVPPSHPCLCQLCPQTSWGKGRHAVASCPQEPGGWGPGQALSHPGLGRGERWGGRHTGGSPSPAAQPSRAAPWARPGQGCPAAPPWGAAHTGPAPSLVQLRPCPSPGSGDPVGR